VGESRLAGLGWHSLVSFDPPQSILIW
jgi:hypothetical protein